MAFDLQRASLGVLPHWPHLRQQYIQDFKSIHLVILSQLYLMFWVWVNSMSQVVTQYRMPQNIPRLPDAGFEYLPHITLKDFTNYYMGALFFMALLRFGLSGRALRMFGRFMMLEGSCFAIRGFMIYVTSLPNPYEYCVSNVEPDESVSWNGLMIMFGQRLTCGDCIPSGHTFALTNLGFMWWDHTRFLPLRLLMFALSGFGWFVIVMTRFHYSIDVTCGILLATLVRFVSCRACGLPFFKHEHNGVPHTLCRFDGHTVENVDTEQLAIALRTHQRLSVSGDTGSEYASSRDGSSTYRRASVSSRSKTAVGSVKKDADNLESLQEMLSPNV